VSINTPFKHLGRKQYDSWLNKDDHILTPSGKIKRASAPIIVRWITKAWKEVLVGINSKIIFKRCLSNAEDGTPDDIFWDDNKHSGEGASSSEKVSATEG
jgi:hypothetical protein